MNPRLHPTPGVGLVALSMLPIFAAYGFGYVHAMRAPGEMGPMWALLLPMFAAFAVSALFWDRGRRAERKWMTVRREARLE